MAEKEATVYIIDVGVSMAEKRHGRSESDLDWAMKYVWEKITTTVATGRKTTHVGVVGLRTDGTSNNLEEEEAFQNISVLLPLQQVLMPDLRSLKERIKPSRTNDGDAISALVVAIDLIGKHCRQLKYIRRVIFVTNGLLSMDTEDEENVDQIIRKIKDDNIEVTVVGTDFDDAEYGFKEEDKNDRKAENEKTLRKLTEDCDGVFGTLEEALEVLTTPKVKPVRPTPLYKGWLTLGDPDKYDSAMVIDIERYPRVMVAKPPTASSFVVRGDGSAMPPSQQPGGESSMQSSATYFAEDGDDHAPQDGLTAVKNSRKYTVDDETAPGGKRDVTIDDLARGYEYGRTAVHISESDQNVVKLETQQIMDIMGFVPRDGVERYFNMSRASTIIAQRTNGKAKLALSSLIHALYELDSYAIARYVSKDGKGPLILLLAPNIESDYECLVDVELPFAEDLRGYRFPPLDRIVTVGGKTIKQHKNLPSDELMNAMSSYIDRMDLSTFGRNEDGEAAEYAPMEDTFSPVLHRVNQAIRHRAVHSDENTIPEPLPVLTKYSTAAEDLLKKAQPALDALIKAGDVKKVPPKQKGRKRTREFEKPLSGLDVDALLNSDGNGTTRKKAKAISRENAVPEFRQLLSSADSIEIIKDAATQMTRIIEGLIKDSVADINYGRAIEAMGVFRSEMIDLEEPGLYNDFLKGLKGKVQREELGGDRREVWIRIRNNRMGLIGKGASAVSDVSEEEVKDFWRLKG